MERARLLDRARRLRRRAAVLERAAGARAGLIWLTVLHGDWARIHGTTQARLDETASDETTAAGDHPGRAVTAALLGDLQTARRAAADAESRDSTDAFVTRGAGLARAVTHLLAGEANSALAVLGELAHTAETVEPYAGLGLLAESAYRAGRPEVAALLLAPVDTPCLPGVRDELVVAHAFLSDDRPNTSAVRSPFALGRIELAHGMRRRRARDEGAARPHLAAALDLFRVTGATPWTQLAANELRASGHRVAPVPQGLTERQLAIVRLAAAGFSNRQIAERLVLSTRTVGTHLYRAFPKLGITSRHQLPSALAPAARDAS